MSLACVTQSRECDGCMRCEPEPVIAYQCQGCKTEILDGDEYYDVAGVPYCADCVSNRTAEAIEYGQYDYV